MSSLANHNEHGNSTQSLPTRGDSVALMSSFANHIEHENSNQSLPTRGDSELGSRYVLESGLYMTSFAATIFVASLVAVGVLLFTLVVTLAILLKSCESKTTGVIQLWRTTDEHDYCRNFAVHAELNNLGVDEFPRDCTDYAYQSIYEYQRDLEMSVQLVENYFEASFPNDDGLDLILMDIDGILSSNFPYQSNGFRLRYNLDTDNNAIKEVENPACMLVLGLHMRLLSSGWSLVFLTRKPEKERNTTINSLTSAGYRGWSSLIMRSENELSMEGWEYMSKRRDELCNQGFRIASVISDEWDALHGPCLGKLNFKLPNPIYFKLWRTSRVSGTLEHMK